MKSFPPVKQLLAALTVAGWFAQAGAAAATLSWGADGLGASGSWTEAGVNWWDGAQAVTWTPGAEAVFQGAGGTVSSYVFGPTVASLTFSTPGYTISGGWLKGGDGGLVVNTVADATISSTLSDNDPFDSAGFVKTGAGRLTVSGVNFFNDVRVEQGEYVATGTSSAFFSDFRVEGGASLTLAPATGSSISVGSISGDGLVQPNAQARTVTATLYGVNDFTGELQDNGPGVLAVTFLSSPRSLLLSRATYTGATQVSSGTLALWSDGAIANSASISINTGAKLQVVQEISTGSDDRLGDTIPICLRGGTLEILGDFGSTVEEAGILSTVGSGYLALTTDHSATAPGIRFSGFQRLESGTLSIANAVNGAVTFTGLANGPTGIVTPAVTLNDSWAVADGAGKLTAFTTYVGQFAGGSALDHVKLTAPSTTTTGLLTRASLHLVSANAGVDQQLALQGTLVLNSGGLLSAGTRAGTISGSTLSAPSELIITNANALTISSTIANTSGLLALTKSGPGTLTLSGTNTYSGITTINQGVLAVANPPALGNGTTILFGGGVLRALGNLSLGKGLAGVGGRSAAIDTNGYTVVSSGAITGSLLKQGKGTLVLKRADIGSVNVMQGTLRALNATSGSVTLDEDTFFDAGGSFTSLTLNGNASLDIGAGTVVTLTLGNLFSQRDEVSLDIDFDIGSAAQDSLVLTSTFGIGAGDGAKLVFYFRNLGDLSTGVDYQVISFGLPGSSFNESNFSLAPALVDAGWDAQFDVTTSGVMVNFAAIPEPAPLALMAMGLFFTGLAFLRRRKATRVWRQEPRGSR